MAMLQGERVSLRPVRESDLDRLYEAHIDLASRGHHYPRGVMSETAFRRDFAEGGFWTADEGTLLILAGDSIVGHLEFFRPVVYWDAFELAYQLHAGDHAGRGYVTEAVQLLVDYLFDTKQRHRIQLVILPENAPSRRVADKCGFQLEGTLRGAFFNYGRNHDVLVYSLLRTDPRPWRHAASPAS